MSKDLRAAAKRALEERLKKLGFTKSNKDGVYWYWKALGDDGVLHFMCRPRSKSGLLLLEPLIALENYKLRDLIGEDEPKQLIPRFAHIFLSYTIGEAVTFWSFSDIAGMNRAVDAIEDALEKGGIPFAQRWIPFRAAVDLLRRRIEDVPHGIMTHPTRSSQAILQNLAVLTDEIH